MRTKTFIFIAATTEFQNEYQKGAEYQKGNIKRDYQ